MKTLRAFWFLLKTIKVFLWQLVVNCILPKLGNSQLTIYSFFQIISFIRGISFFLPRFILGGGENLVEKDLFSPTFPFGQTDSCDSQKDQSENSLNKTEMKRNKNGIQIQKILLGRKTSERKRISIECRRH